MSVAVDACVYLWHRGGEVVAVHRVLGGGGGLLLEVKVEGERLELELPERAVGELVRELVEHVVDHGIETGVEAIDEVDA